MSMFNMNFWPPTRESETLMLDPFPKLYVPHFLGRVPNNAQVNSLGWMEFGNQKGVPNRLFLATISLVCVLFPDNISIFGHGSLLSELSNDLPMATTALTTTFARGSSLTAGSALSSFGPAGDEQMIRERPGGNCFKGKIASDCQALWYFPNILQIFPSRNKMFELKVNKD